MKRWFTGRLVRMAIPAPALSYEDMWFRLKAELAATVLNRRTPIQVLKLRDLMGELELERTRPMVAYIRERNGDRNFDRFRKADQ
jgi:hypothetical protein